MHNHPVGFFVGFLILFLFLICFCFVLFFAYFLQEIFCTGNAYCEKVVVIVPFFWRIKSLKSIWQVKNMYPLYFVRWSFFLYLLSGESKVRKTIRQVENVLSLLLFYKDDNCHLFGLDVLPNKPCNEVFWLYFNSMMLVWPVVGE